MADEPTVVVTEDEAPAEAPVNPEVEKLQKESDRRQKEMRLKHEKALKAQKEENDKLKKQLEDLLAATKAPAKGETPAASADERDALAVKLELMEKRFAQKEAEYQEALTKEKKAREEAEYRHRLNERDRLLSEALDAVGVNNKTLAVRYFQNQIIEDEVENEWMYKTLDGRVIPIREGVEFELPPELKPPALRAGGSGTSGSAPVGKSRIQKQVEQLETELSNLRKASEARRGSDPHLITQYQAKQRELRALMGELAKTTK